MNAYGLIQSVIKPDGLVLALSAFIIIKPWGIPTLFVFSLKSYCADIALTQQFVKHRWWQWRTQYTQNWNKIMPALFGLAKSCLSRLCENTSSCLTVCLLPCFMQGVFLQCLQNLVTSSRVGFGVLLTLISSFGSRIQHTLGCFFVP